MDRAILERIRQQTDIVEIISEFATLEKSGGDYTCVCPFPDHNENIPSFRISAKDQLYYCFGCKRGGDVFTFLQAFNRMSFMESVKFLAKRLNIKISSDNKESSFDALIDAYGKMEIFFYNQQFKNDYFINTRGLGSNIIDLYGLGYDPGSGYPISYKDKYIDESGLFTETGISKFSNRYIFPFVDINGRVIGFAGGNPKSKIKYLNIQETKVYKKSEFLYGIYQAKDSVIKNDYVIVVEGYFDCLSLVAGGFTNTVAVCGTAFTSAHAKLLKRFTNNVVLMFDSDKAGEEAIDRAFIPLFKFGFNTYIAVLPNGEDPDSYIRKDLKGFKESLCNIISWFEHRLPKEDEPQKIIERVNYARELLLDFDDLQSRELFSSVVLKRYGVNILDKKNPVRKVYSNNELNKDNFNQILLLACAISGNTIDSSLFDDRFIGVFNHVSALNNISELYTGVENESDIKLLTAAHLMSNSELDVSLIVESCKRDKLEHNINDLKMEIKEKELAGVPCSDLVCKLNEYVNDKRSLL